MLFLTEKALKVGINVYFNTVSSLDEENMVCIIKKTKLKQRYEIKGRHTKKAFKSELKYKTGNRLYFTNILYLYPLPQRGFSKIRNYRDKTKIELK